MSSTTRTPGEFIRRRLAWAEGFRWFDRVGVLELDGDRLARIELRAPVIVGSYSRVEVKIVSKRAGVIDSEGVQLRRLPARHAGGAGR